MDGGFMDLAQKRIREAMERASCSESDLDKHLGLRPGTVAKVLAGEPGMHPYAERIALDLGRNNAPQPRAKCANTYFWTAARKPVEAKNEAAQLLEEILGIDLDELSALKPQIEMLVVAKRNGVPARVIVDPVEVV